jgi:Tfp pilus assembly protein PilE
VVLAIPFMVATMGVLAAIAIPNFVKARECSQRNVCMSNLRMLEASKEQPALERGGGSPGTHEAVAFAGRDLRCPNGGSYTVSGIGAEPACSVHGTLSAPRDVRGVRSRR